MIRKMKSRQGLARIFAILLLLIAVLAALIVLPGAKRNKERAEAIACATAMDTAKRRLAEDYLMGNGEQTAEGAKEAVTFAMDGWDDICPAGGKVYLVETDEGALPYTLVCGIHDKDAKLRTRLNSGYVLDQLKEALKKSQDAGDTWPAELAFRLNGKEEKALLVGEDMGFKRGTATTKGYEKKEVVAFYGISGRGDSFADAGEAGELCYFSFADKEHCANWNLKDGWTGDSYQYLMRFEEAG